MSAHLGEKVDAYQGNRNLGEPVIRFAIGDLGFQATCLSRVRREMTNSHLLLGWLVIPFVVLASSVCAAYDASPCATIEPPFRGLVTPSEGGRILNVLGESITVKAGPAETGGAYAVVEERSPPGGGAPWHTHTTEDEIFYVLEGQLEFHLGQEKWVAGPGTTAVMPRGIPHAFRNIGSAPSKMLVIISPGRLLEFFKEIDALSRQQEVTPADVSRIGTDYKLTIHPPPTQE